MAAEAKKHVFARKYDEAILVFVITVIASLPRNDGDV